MKNKNILKKYIKHRFFLVIILLASLLTIFLLNYKKNYNIKLNLNNKQHLFSQITDYFKEKNIKITEFLPPDFKYSVFNNQKLYFIGEKNGVKDVFSALIRLFNDGSVIDLKDEFIFSDTPLVDEYNLVKKEKYIAYESNYDDIYSIHLVFESNMINITMKKKGIIKINYSENSIFINNIEYFFNNLETNEIFFVFKEKIFKKSKSFIENLIFEDKKEFKTNIFKNFKEGVATSLNIDKQYIHFSAKYSKNNDKIDFYQLKIIDKPILNLFVLNKENYFIELLNSGSYFNSKTGNIITKTEKPNSFFLDVNVLGGLKIDNYLLKPVVSNYSTVLINKKNNIIFGNYLAENRLLDFMQFSYPIIYKNNQNVQIENLKINSSIDSKKNELKSGICLKNNNIIIFYGTMQRGQITDYMFLLDCDYAFETNSENLNYEEKIKNNNKTLISFYNKNYLTENLKFKQKDNIYFYDDDFITIYKVNCGNLSLDYNISPSDPLSNNFQNISSDKKIDKNDIILKTGTINPITPDGLFFDNQLYYQSQNKYKFHISKDSCGINKKVENSLFFKEGELILNNNKIYSIIDSKYQEILLGAGIKEHFIYFFSFKKHSTILKLLEYMKKLDIQKGIVFENNSSENNSPEIIIKKGQVNEIFE